MKKRLLTICLLLAGMLCISGCGSSNLSENQIKEDLTAQGDIALIDIGYGSYFEERDLQITDVVINKRQTNEKDDTVYCTVTMEDDWYRCSADYVLYYNFYDQGGWILDDYYAEGQMITPLKGVPEEFAEGELNNYFFDTYELVDSSFNEEDWSAELTYHLTYDRMNVSFDDDATLYYYFSSEGNEGTWTPSLFYDETSFKWDVLGEWKRSESGGLQWDITIKDVNLGAGEASIHATIADRRAQATTGDNTTVSCYLRYSDISYEEESPYNEPMLIIGDFSMEGDNIYTYDSYSIGIYPDAQVGYLGENREGFAETPHVGSLSIEKIN